MFIRKNFAIIQFKLNQLDIRERLGVLISILLLLLLSWYTLLYQTQYNLSKSIDEKNTLVRQQSKIIDVKKRHVENQVMNPNTKQWLKQYDNLKKQIAAYKRKIINYKEQILSEKKLVVMLNSVFNEINQLTMVDFISISETDDQQVKTLKTKFSHKLMRKYYKLHLRGGYFAMMSYLKKIEDLPWQIYWEEMFYKVKSYPTAELEISFHVMSKEND